MGIWKDSLSRTSFNHLLTQITETLQTLKNGRDITLEFKTVEETESFPSTSIRVKPNQTPITEDSNILERIKDTQKEITDIYQELSYEELTNVLNEWLNPDEETTETSTEEPKTSK